MLDQCSTLCIQAHLRAVGLVSNHHNKVNITISVSQYSFPLHTKVVCAILQSIKHHVYKNNVQT